MSISFRRSTALLATGCALVGASVVAASPADAATHRGTFYVHSTSKHLVAGASTVRPGIVQVHNTGNRVIVLLGKKHAGVDKLVKDLKSNGLKVFSDFAVRGVVLPHRSIYLRLHRGALFTFDGMRMHYPASSIHTVTIAGKTINAKLPYSRAITVTGHNILKVPANVGHNTSFHVINNSNKTQDIALFRVTSATSLSDIKAAAANPTDANLEKLDLASVVELAELSPHQTLWTRLNGAKGNGLVVALTISGKNITFFRKGGLGAIHFH